MLHQVSNLEATESVGNLSEGEKSPRQPVAEQVDVEGEVQRDPEWFVNDFLAQNWDEIEASIIVRLRTFAEGHPGLFDGGEFETEVIPEVIRKEMLFATRVIEAYARWAQEEDPIVLWDIDDTMGHNDHTDNPSVMEWRFRDALLPVLDYVSSQFPTVINGISSNRESENTLLKLTKGGALEAISKYIDRKYVFTSRDKVSHEDRRQAEEKIYEETGSYPFADEIDRQFLIDEKLREGLNIKVIDDNPVSKKMGMDGVWLGDAMAT